MKICYIVGAAPVKEITIPKKLDDFVIAADGGMDTLKRNGMQADLWLGDMDSTKEEQQEGCRCFPSEKDETDMFLAIMEGFKRNYETFVIWGGLGGRMDHSIANMAHLVYLAKRGKRGYLIDEKQIITAIYNDTITLEQERGMISIFSAEEEALGVSIRGLKYPLEDGILKGEFPLGVSNEFIGEKAEITVEQGVLWILIERI